MLFARRTPARLHWPSHGGGTTGLERHRGGAVWLASASLLGNYTLTQLTKADMHWNTTPTNGPAMHMMESGHIREGSCSGRYSRPGYASHTDPAMACFLVVFPSTNVIRPWSDLAMNPIHNREATAALHATLTSCVYATQIYVQCWL